MMILNVDDHEIVRYSRSRLLRQAGYEVKEAASGHEALQIVRQEQPALVLLDVHLPDVSGLEVCRSIKSDPTLASTMVLQLSASHISSQDRVIGLNGGADSYLTEPVEPEELLAQIRALLRLVEAERKLAGLNETLEQRVQASQTQLYRQNVELEQRVAEATGSLMRERERLSVALRAGQLGVYEWRMGESSVWWSPEVYPLYGVEPGSFTPTVEGFSSMVHPDDRAELWRKTEESIARREVFTQEYRIFRPNGELRWIFNRSHVVLDAAGQVERITGVAMDITERKQAEEAAARLAAIVSTSVDPIVSKTLDGIITSWNESAERMFGYTAEEMIHQPILRLIPPELHAEEALILARLRAGERIEHYETVRMTKDGRRLDVSLTISPIKDSTGKITGASKIVRDITERKRAEEQLRASRDTFRQLVENSPFGIYVVDADFRLAQVGAGAQKVFENVHPLIGRDFAEVLRLIWAEPFASEAISRFRHTLTTGESYHSPSTVERRHDIDEVEAYDWKIERITLPDGRFGVVCHFYDLSERQRFEAALRASGERLRLATEAADMFSWECDFQQQTINWSENTARLLDCAPEVLPEDLAHSTFFADPNEAERLSEEFAEFLRQGATHYTQEFKGREMGHQTRYWRAHALIFYDTSGVPLRSVGITQNITAHKQAEVSERMLAEMRERNRLAQELHDTVAQALGYLNLKINMAYTSMAGHDVEAAKSHLAELKSIISETYTDVREEIFYLRAKALSDLSFMELLERYIDKYRRFYNLEIQHIQEADPAMFEFPAEVTSQLIRTIQEALINIRKHAHVSTAIIRLGQDAGQLCISIEDEGRGFDLDRIKGQNNSFGLQIMRERVESVGGRLAVETTPGQGVCITLSVARPDRR